MGWTYTHKPRGKHLFNFFSEEFNHEFGRVLDVAPVGYTEAYIAYQVLDKEKKPEKVVAIMCLIRYTRDHYNFGYKDMDETMGPYYYNCPARILKQLTPTDNETALAWRNACQERLDKRKARKKLKVGDMIRFDKALKFTDGSKLSDFIVVKLRPFRLVDANGYGYPYRLRNDTFEHNTCEVVGCAFPPVKR